MQKTSAKIVFFGSGPVAAKSLEILAENFTIEAVVTKPKPPHHKGSFPVLEVAERLKIRILPVRNKQELDELFETKPVASRIGVLVDFGIIVSQQVIDYFPLGIVNSHFSLLPEWRGADPITFSILSGQERTGVSLMLLVERMDEGPLLAFGLQDIAADMTTPELTQRLILLSDALLQVELPRYLAGEAKLTSQGQISQLLTDYPSQPTYSRKLAKEDGIIDWHKPAVTLEREIRAFTGWPRSRTKLAGRDVIITKAHSEVSQGGNSMPGEIEKTENGEADVVVATGKGTLCIERLIPAGKREMSAREFIAGYGKLL